MTDNPAISPSSPRWPAVSLAIAFFLLCSALAGICWWAAGPTLGLFLGPPALLAIVLPQAVSVSGRARQRWLIWLLASAATALTWFSALPGMDGINARQVGQCVIILSAFNLLLIGLTDVLLWSGIRPTAAAALTTMLSLIWLTWPIWLSGHLASRWGESVANCLVSAHPLFTINASLQHFDLWDHIGLMYSTLSILNQDVPYRVPQSIWPSVLLHASPAVIILVAHPIFARHPSQKKLNRQAAETPR